MTRSHDVNELAALIQVEGTFTNERHDWRASRTRDDCGGTLDNDFFVVKELNVDKPNDATSERQHQFEQVSVTNSFHIDLGKLPWSMVSICNLNIVLTIAFEHHCLLF